MVSMSFPVGVPVSRFSLLLRIIVPHFGHTHRRVLLLALGGFGAPVWLLPGPLLAVPVPHISAHVRPSVIWISCQPIKMMKSNSSSDGLVMVQPYFS